MDLFDLGSPLPYRDPSSPAAELLQTIDRQLAGILL
jgi:hypothetical protein